MMRYNNPIQQRAKSLSMSPSYLDQSQNYEDLIPSNLNPLASVSGGNSNELPRGAFTYYNINNPVIATAGAATASVDVVITEPMMLSPWLYGEQCGPGLLGLKTITVIYNLVSNLGSAIWSSANSPNRTLSSINVTLNAVPTLYCKFITPKLVVPIPPNNVYNYFNIERFSLDFSSLAANTSTSYSSNNIQLSSIPERIYVYARQSNNTQTFGTTDTFLGITGVSVLFENRSGLLSSASQQQLYMMSVNNGLQDSWMQFSGVYPGLNTTGLNTCGAVGSVLCFNPAVDFGLSSIQANNVLTNIQFQIKVNVVNLNQTKAITPSLYVVIVSGGSFNILSGTAVSQIGTLSPNDVLHAQEDKSLTTDDLKNVYGGSFYTNLRKSLGQVGKFIYNNKLISRGLSSVAPIAGPYSPYLNVASQVANALGAGEGGAIVGGKKMSKKQLHDRLIRY